ncbi:MAG: hypothetical protein ACJA0U_002618 [Salibacteraceae bacterium]|jgi:hypothetical protein
MYPMFQPPCAQESKESEKAKTTVKTIKIFMNQFFNQYRLD